jgi:hypothetical protein
VYIEKNSGRMSGSHDLPCQMIRPLRSESTLSYSIREDDLAGNRAGRLRSRGRDRKVEKRVDVFMAQIDGLEIVWIF